MYRFLGAFLGAFFGLSMAFTVIAIFLMIYGPVP